MFARTFARTFATPCAVRSPSPIPIPKYYSPWYYQLTHTFGL